MSLDLGSGTRISHYRILGEIGEDALGPVLRAVDELLDRPVALKVVHAAAVYSPLDVPVMRARFRRDAQHAAQLNHPNLVTIHSFERLEGADLIVMELVEGHSLRQLLTEGERWRMLDAARLAARIADGLAAAHAVGLRHGRLDLDSVVVRADGRVKVLGLGLPRVPVSAERGDAAAIVAAAMAEATPSGEPFREDVAALGRVTWELVASGHRPPNMKWQPVLGEPADLDASLEGDASHVRATFGVLSPVLVRALGVGGTDRFLNAGEFRDAILAVIEQASRRSATPPVRPEGPETALGGGTRIVLPVAAGAAARDVLESDGESLAALHRAPGEMDAPRLVLPADLAHNAHLPPPGSFVVLGPATRGERLRGAADQLLGGSIARGVERGRPHALVAVVVVLALAVGAVFAARHFLASGGLTAAELIARLDGRSDNPPAADPPAPPAGELVAALPRDSTPRDSAAAGSDGVPPVSATNTADAVTVPAADPPPEPVQRPPEQPRERGAADARPVARRVTEGAVEAPPPAANAPAGRSALVRARPVGTSIRVAGLSEGWTTQQVLSVRPGDSLVVRFSKPGYLSESHFFTGQPLDVTLRPDSVMVGFDSNLPARVYVADANGGEPRLIGVTNFSERLRTGTYRFIFRAAGVPDYTTTQDLTLAGGHYRVQKTDFAARGTFVITVPGGWARASVDGGEERDTPVRFEDLAAGSHIVRLTRPGFATLTDTVTIEAGQTVTRQYVLRPGG